MLSSSVRTVATRKVGATMTASSSRIGAAGVRTSYSTSSIGTSTITKQSLTVVRKGVHNNNNQHLHRHTIQSRGMAGDMPVPQSSTAKLWEGHTVAHEGWEESIYFYYAAGILLQAAVLMGAPETSIESWARPEAQARLLLKNEGQTEFEFGTHYQDVIKKQNLELWSQFAAKAVTPGEDDDDDDDDEDDDDDDEEDDDDDEDDDE